MVNLIQLDNTMKKLFLILLLLFFLFGCFSDFDVEKDIKLLREVCSELPLPPNIHKLEERAITKSDGGVFTIYYSHESSCVDVVNHYQTVLNKRGWKRVPISIFNNPDIVEFKKGELDISIDCKKIGDFWGTKRYSMSCSKGLRGLFE